MSTILWLASYPKSGNTWLRAFLQSYRQDGGPVDLNALDAAALDWQGFAQAVGVPPADLTADEVRNLRPAVHRSQAAHGVSLRLLKVHDAFERTPAGEWLLPPEVSRGAIYLLRNPLDVAVSLAHHMQGPVERAVELMCSPPTMLRPLPQALAGEWFGERLLSWSGHVLSWVDQRAISVHVVRYEDMQARPLETFAGVVACTGAPLDRDRVQRAVEASRFDRLQAQEAERPFLEGPWNVERFFRTGVVGDWRTALPPRPGRAPHRRARRGHAAVWLSDGGRRAGGLRARSSHGKVAHAGTIGASVARGRECWPLPPPRRGGACGWRIADESL